MTVEEIEAIVGGYHGDAFRILGPHSIRRKGAKARWEIRAFLPQAESAEATVGAERVAMIKQHARGFFVATLNGDPATYLIRARLFDGCEIEIDDPYRFGPQLSDTDLYLHTGRTLLEAGRLLGPHEKQPGAARVALFPVGPPMPKPSRSPANSTIGKPAA